jgi:hypothetical protein
VYFSHGTVDALYPPWGSWVVARLTLESLVGLTLAGVSLAVLKRAVHPVSAVCALLALPVLWTIFLGQLEGLITLGLSALPWLVMLALLKPQLSTFAFGARPSYIAAFFIWVAISLVIWGWWPGRMLGFESYYGEGRLATDISLHGYGRLGRSTQLLAGGRNRALAAHVAEHVAVPGYHVITDLDTIPRELRGLHPDNPVNRVRGGGAQLELSPRVRGISPRGAPPGDAGCPRRHPP